MDGMSTPVVIVVDLNHLPDYAAVETIKCRSNEVGQCRMEQSLAERIWCPLLPPGKKADLATSEIMTEKAVNLTVNAVSRVQTPVAGIAVTNNLHNMLAQKIQGQLRTRFPAFKVVTAGTIMPDKDRDENPRAAIALRLLETGAFVECIPDHGY